MLTNRGAHQAILLAAFPFGPQVDAEVPFHASRRNQHQSTAPDTFEFRLGFEIIDAQELSLFHYLLSLWVKRARAYIETNTVVADRDGVPVEAVFAPGRHACQAWIGGGVSNQIEITADQEPFSGLLAVFLWTSA